MFFIIAFLIAALGPGIFWLWYIYRKDKYEPEPRKLVVRTFFWGVFSTIPAIALEAPFSILGISWITSVIAAPLVEEYLKYGMVRWTIFNHAEFDEPMDGIVYASAAALGFASAENVIYLLSASNAGDMATTAVIRALLSVPGHALFSSFWGFALGMAKFAPAEKRRAIITRGLLAAMLSHAAFNGMLELHPLAGLGVLVLIPVLWRIFGKRVKQAEDVSPFRNDAPPAGPQDPPAGV